MLLQTKTELCMRYVVQKIEFINDEATGMKDAFMCDTCDVGQVSELADEYWGKDKYEGFFHSARRTFC